MQLSYLEKQIYLNKIIRNISWVRKTPGFLFVSLITIYQWTLSPDHGIVSFFTIGRCKFRPTCSQYTKNAIKHYGVRRGARLGLKQVMKCH